MKGGARAGAGRPVGSKSRDTRTVQEKLDDMGCDPFVILGHFAKGDVVALKYMTQEELEDPGEFYIKAGRQVWTREPGHRIAARLIDSKVQKGAASDLAQYTQPKLTSQSLTVPSGVTALGVGVMLMMPPSGREADK